jgi:hypothetical protein
VSGDGFQFYSLNIYSNIQAYFNPEPFLLDGSSDLNEDCG